MGVALGLTFAFNLDPEPRLRRECTDSPRLKPARRTADIRWHLCADVRRRCGLDGPCVQVDGGHALAAAATWKQLVVQTECASGCSTSDPLKFNLMVLMDCEPTSGARFAAPVNHRGAS
jgi:hypothetical protein